MKRCNRDEKGRFAKHNWQGTACMRCGITDRLRGALKNAYLPTLHIGSLIALCDIADVMMGKRRII